MWIQESRVCLRRDRIKRRRLSLRLEEAKSFVVVGSGSFKFSSFFFDYPVQPQHQILFNALTLNLAFFIRHRIQTRRLNRMFYSTLYFDFRRVTQRRALAQQHTWYYSMLNSNISVLRVTSVGSASKRHQKYFMSCILRISLKLLENSQCFDKRADLDRRHTRTRTPTFAIDSSQKTLISWKMRQSSNSNVTYFYYFNLWYLSVF